MGSGGEDEVKYLLGATGCCLQGLSRVCEEKGLQWAA